MVDGVAVSLVFLGDRFGGAEVFFEARAEEALVRNVPGAPVPFELVALGVTPEVVVVLEQQHTRAGMLLAVEERGGQSTDTGTDHDKVVFGPIRLRSASPVGALRECHLVSNLEGPRMAPPQPEPRGRVRAGSRRRAEHAGRAGRNGRLVRRRAAGRA